jgi:hypothetical protein
MKKLDEIETNAKMAVIHRQEGSMHYVAPEFIKPEVALSLTAALRELIAYAADPNNPHDESCSYITTYDHKSLDCDCFKAVIPQTIARHLGEEVAMVNGVVAG